MACEIDSKRKGFTFIWILENFEYCWQKTGKSLISPSFIVDNVGKQQTKWSLSIKPRGFDSDEWISLYLCRKEECMGSFKIEIDYEISILASNGSVLSSQVECNHTFLKGGSWGFPKFEKRANILAKGSKFLVRGVLTMQCRMWMLCEKKVKDSGICIARTCISVERRTFLWKIPKKYPYRVGIKILKLKSNSDDNTVMTVKLQIHELSSTLAIFLEPCNFDNSIMISTFKSSLIDARGNYLNCGKKELWFSPTMHDIEKVLSVSKDTLMSNSSLYLPKKFLTLYCEYAFSSGVAFEGIEEVYHGCIDNFISNNVVLENMKNTKSDSEASGLKRDLSSLFKQDFLTDVKLCTESETFSAHKIILSASSPVFRDLFQKKKGKTQILIKDLKPDTVRRMLLYMYTDSLEDLQLETASDLYIAAKKYQIISLEDKCSSFLAEASGLKMDFSSLLKQNFLTDVKLCTESETFSAHKIILSARSPVFRALFHTKKKKAIDQIVIKDLKTDTVRRLLLYMYTDSLEDLQLETASDLYVAAKKYRIVSLEDKCSSFLADQSSPH